MGWDGIGKDEMGMGWGGKIGNVGKCLGRWVGFW